MIRVLIMFLICFLLIFTVAFVTSSAVRRSVSILYYRTDYMLHAPSYRSKEEAEAKRFDSSKYNMAYSDDIVSFFLTDTGGEKLVVEVSNNVWMVEAPLGLASMHYGISSFCEVIKSSFITVSLVHKNWIVFIKFWDGSSHSVYMGEKAVDPVFMQAKEDEPDSYFYLFHFSSEQSECCIGIDDYNFILLNGKWTIETDCSNTNVISGHLYPVFVN